MVPIIYFIIPQDFQNVVFSSNNIIISNEWQKPIVYPTISDNWQHLKRRQDLFKLAGIKGTKHIDVFSSGGIILIREIWSSILNDAFALRQVLLNKTGHDIYLESLFPVALHGAESLRLDNNDDPSNWDILIQHRLKNERPQTLRPSGKASYEIDQFALFHNRVENKSPAMFIGFISQTDHCARMLLDFDGSSENTKVKSFLVESEFDSCLVPAGGTRSSQWVLMMSGDDPNHLISEYANMIGAHHGVPMPPKNAPSVFCSWYFHGYYYNEEYFHQDINALAKETFPFDVFLIDECWSLNQWGDFEAIES